MDYKFNDFLDLLKQLIRQPSVVGAEHSFFRSLQRELEETGAKVTLYQGLLVAQGSNPEARMISSHIDRHGLICTGPNEFQSAAFIAGQRGDQSGNAISEKTFNIIADRFNNEPVVAYEPWSGAYRGAGTIKKAYLCERRGNIVFEVEGLGHAIAGTPVAFQDRLRMVNGYIMAQLDNVLTAAALVFLFQSGYQGTAFFTAQEESQRSWRFLLEWFQRLDVSTKQLIVLDTSPDKDREDADQQKVVLRHRDSNGIFDPETTTQLVNICESLEIPYGFKDEYFEKLNVGRKKEGLKSLPYGGTELGRLVEGSEGRIQGTTLQVPTTGYHTSSETASIVACKAFIDVLMEFAVTTP